MKNIVVVYGGRSPEHDISILTGLHCAKHITDDYVVRLVYITRRNKFMLGGGGIDDYISGKCDRWAECRFANGALYKCGVLGKKVCDVLCVVNCCHGGSGENGELAGLMNIAGIPMTGCGAMSAYNQQSKTATREILTAHSFVQPKFQRVSKDNPQEIKIDLPVIVKPDCLGSSIGIMVARTAEELRNGLDLAFTMCDTAVAEEYIADAREVNIAVMRKNGGLAVSAPEVVGGKNFFSFEEKYFNTESGFVKKGAGADDEFIREHEAEIGELAKQAYEIFGSCGIVRSDFLITPERIILNENNTVPGFMAYHLFLKKGVPYGVIIDDIINDAVDKFRASRTLKTEFGSEILLKNRILTEKQ